jgi:uncharacterized repeat protein (TIGR03803 family)
LLYQRNHPDFRRDGCLLLASQGQGNTSQPNPRIDVLVGDFFVKTKSCLTLVSLAVITALLNFAVSAQAATRYTIVRNFSESRGGVLPAGELLIDEAGNLYGTDTQGGSTGGGTIFALRPNGQTGFTYEVLYECNKSFDCTLPVGSLVMDRAGNLYGSTLFGNVFKLSKTASGSWAATVLHQFGVEIAPPSSLILDTEGNLYGINPTGGKNNLGYVFELSPSQRGWSLTHLHDFSGRDGAATTGSTENQVGGLIFDSVGNLYGATVAGGASTKCSGGCGVVFELTKNFSTWSETVLHTFNGGDGANPIAPLMMDADGNLYGTASSGGAKGFGSAFKMSRASGVWQTRVLHSFTGAHLDGEFPDSALVMDENGNLFGTTESGGGAHQSCQVWNDFGCGTVFELSLNGTQWKETILKAFSGGKDGAFPQGVVLDGSGNLFGAAQAGGRQFEGLLFEISSGSATQ